MYQSQSIEAKADDFAHSKWNPALNQVKELLDTEYHCITILKHEDPERMVKKIRWLSYVTSKPDLIVAYGLGKPEYLTITHPMVLGYKHLEIKAMENGYNNGAHSLFFTPDIETATYKEHIKLFGDAAIVPGENIHDQAGIESMVTFIKGVLEVDG